MTDSSDEEINNMGLAGLETRMIQSAQEAAMIAAREYSPPPLDSDDDDETEEEKKAHLINHTVELLRTDPEEILCSVADQLSMPSHSQSLIHPFPRQARNFYVYQEELPMDEDRVNEFKAIQISQNPAKTILGYIPKYVNSFLNSTGGTIFFGVEDDGVAFGVPLARGARDKLRLHCDFILENYWPPVSPEMFDMRFVPVVELEPDSFQIRNKFKERWIVEISVMKGEAPVYLMGKNKAQAYIRREGSCYKMHKEMILQKVFYRDTPLGRYTEKAHNDSFAASSSSSSSSSHHDDYDGDTTHVEHPSKHPSNKQRNKQTANTQYTLEHPPSGVMGRQKEIQTFVDYVRDRSDQVAVKVVSIYGPGGMGKTTVALTLAHDLAKKHNFKGNQFAIKLLGSTNEPVTVEEAMSFTVRAFYPNINMPKNENELQAYYMSCFREKKSILFLDDAQSVEQVRALLPKSPVVVIVTSRKNLSLDLHISGAISYRLQALDQDTSTNMLKNVWEAAHGGSKASQSVDGELERLAALCCGLPLALQVVSAILVKSNNLTIEQLIERLERKGGVLKLENSAVEQCMQTSFELLNQDQQEFFKVLQVFEGQFDDQAAAAVAETDIHDARDILGELMSNSLVEFDASKWSYHIHDLVRQFAVEALPMEDDRLEHLWELYMIHYSTELQRATEIRTSDPEDGNGEQKALAIFDNDLHHFKKVFQLTLERDPPAASAILEDAQVLFRCRLHPNELIVMYSQLCDRLDQQEESHVREIPFAMNGMGWGLTEQGQYVEAEEKYLEALGMFDNVSAALSSNAGMSRRERKLIASIKLNLGELYCHQCRYVEAGPHLDDAHQIERDISANSSSVARTLIGLSNLNVQVGKYELAISRVNEAMKLYVAAHHGSENNTEVAICLTRLGKIHQIQGKYREALDLFNRALELQERIYGVWNVFSATTRKRIGRTLGSLGRYPEAKEMLKQTQEILESCLGPDHPKVANVKRNIAFQAFFFDSEDTLAEKMFLEVLESCENSVGKEHQETVFTMNDLALLYNHLSRFDESEPLYLESLDIRCKIFGRNHPYTAVTLNDIGNLYRLQSRNEEAEEALKQALEIRRNALGNDSPEVARTLTNLANLYRKMKRLQEAEQMYGESLEIRIRVFGENHSEVGATYNAMAQLFQYKKDYKRVEELYRKAIAINTATVGGDHPNTIQNRINLANTLRSQPGREGEALIEFRKAYESTASMPGETRRATRMGSIVPLFARGLVKEAKKHLGQGEKQSALALLEEAELVYESQKEHEWSKRLAEINRLKVECGAGENKKKEKENNEDLGVKKTAEIQETQPTVGKLDMTVGKPNLRMVAPGLVVIMVLILILVWMARAMS